MAKLPTAVNFGARPSPAVGGQATPGAIPSGQGAAPGLARAANAQARAASESGAPLDVGAQLAGAFAQAQAKIDSRDDAVERSRAITTFNEEAAGELRRLQTEGDFSSRETAQAYVKGLDERMSKLLNDHGGSADSRVALQERLTGVRSHYSMQAADLRLKAQETLVLNTLGTSLKNLTSIAYEAPGEIGRLYQDLDTQIDDMAAALTPESELEHRTIGRAQIAASALESLLDRGQFESARELMQTTPGITEVLSPEKQRELQGRITAFQQAEVKAASEGMAKLNELRTILGREPTPAERAQYAGVAPPRGERSLADKISEAETVLNRPLTQGERERIIGLEPEKPATAQTPAGQYVRDLEMFKSEFGDDSPQVQAFEELASAPDIPKMTEIGGMRKEFTAASRAFVERRDAAGGIAAAAQQNTGAGDIALVYGFVRMMSPGIVSDKEADMVASTGGAGQMVKLAWERWKNGDRLTPDMRQSLQDTAEAVMRAQAQSQIRLEQQFLRHAQLAGFDPSNVLTDFLGEYRPEGAGLPWQTDAAGQPKAEEKPKPRYQVDMQGNIVGGGNQ